jgi:hypothetical protein
MPTPIGYRAHGVSTRGNRSSNTRGPEPLCHWAGRRRTQLVQRKSRRRSRARLALDFGTSVTSGKRKRGQYILRASRIASSIALQRHYRANRSLYSAPGAEDGQVRGAPGRLEACGRHSVADSGFLLLVVILTAGYTHLPCHFDRRSAPRTAVEKSGREPDVSGFASRNYRPDVNPSGRESDL